MKLIVGGASQGKERFAKSVCEGHRLIRDYHLIIREQLTRGADPVEEAKKLFERDPKTVIVSNEVGMGVVPMEAFERKYREAVGRTHIQIAELSDEVYRVICGIGQRIK